MFELHGLDTSVKLFAGLQKGLPALGLPEGLLAGLLKGLLEGLQKLN